MFSENSKSYVVAYISLKMPGNGGFKVVGSRGDWTVEFGFVKREGKW